MRILRLLPYAVVGVLIGCLGAVWHHSWAAETPSAFQLALPGYRYSFPRDHASHPEYRTEWWYYTGHLRAEDGRHFGYELTFFRNALLPRLENRTSKWATRDVIVAHFTVTDETTGKFYSTDRIGRAAVGLAGADIGAAHVWLGAWSLTFGGKDETQHLVADAPNLPTEIGLDLQQQPRKALVEEGENGVSQKSAGLGHASHYYSFTRLATSGTLRLGNEQMKVSGQSWFDHEFGSNQMAPEEVGWDWFSIQLDDNRELMLYRLRHKDGSADPYSSGTLVESDGSSHHLKLDEFQIESLDRWHSPHSGGDYPAHWRVTLPGRQLQFDILPTVADQELDTRRSTGITYWEGSVRVDAIDHGRAVKGVGYVELTGYAQAFAGNL